MRAEGGHDLRVNIGHTKIQRVAVREIRGPNLDQGGRKLLDDSLCAVARTRVDNHHLTGSERCRIKYRRQRLADETRLVLSANHDRNTRLKAQTLSLIAL